MFKYLIFLIICFPVFIFSSNYSLEDIATEFEMNENIVKNLSDNGIKNTNELLNSNLTATIRVKNSKKYSIKIDKLHYWVSLCDLMRINGIGSSAAKLLYYSNVKSISTFTKTDLEKLEKTLEETNKKYNFAPFTPNLEQLQNWQKQAQKLENILK